MMYCIYRVDKWRCCSAEEPLSQRGGGGGRNRTPTLSAAPGRSERIGARRQQHGAAGRRGRDAAGISSWGAAELRPTLRSSCGASPGLHRGLSAGTQRAVKWSNSTQWRRTTPVNGWVLPVLFLPVTRSSRNKSLKDYIQAFILKAQAACIWDYTSGFQNKSAVDVETFLLLWRN